MEVPEFSAEDVRQAVGEIGEFLASDGVVAALREVGADEQLWARVEPLPRDYLGRRKVSPPEGFEIVFEGKWPGRKCFKICRSIDPIPPPPDPTGITICVELCLPG